MSSNNSPPSVRQNVEESVANSRMEKRLVLSEWNLLHVDLRDPVLLPIGELIKENQWEYLHNCTCLAFPILVQEFYGHMTVI